MTKHLGLVVWAAAGVLALAALSACSDSSEGPAASGTQPTSTSETTSPPTTSPPASPTEAASAQAAALIARYFSVLDAVRKDPSASISRLSSVAVSTQLGALKHLVSRERERRQHQTGDTTVAASKVQAVNLDNSDPAAGKVPVVTVDVCWDVSDVDVVDRHGKSIVSATRPDLGWVRYTVANYHWARNPSGGWRVANGEELNQAPCSPA